MKNTDDKTLLLQEKLSVQRTIMSNNRTFLSFLRTALYFMVAGLSVDNLLKIEDDIIIHITFYGFAAIIFLLGVVSFFRQRKKIHRSKHNISDAKEKLMAGE